MRRVLHLCAGLLSLLFVCLPAVAGLIPANGMVPPSRWSGDGGEIVGGPGFFIASFVPLKVEGKAVCSVPRYFMRNPRFLKMHPVRCYTKTPDLMVRTDGIAMAYTGYAVKDYVLRVTLAGRTDRTYSVFLAWLNDRGKVVGVFNGSKWVKEWTPVASGKVRGSLRGSFTIPLIDSPVKLLGGSSVDYLFFGIKNDRGMWVYAAVYPVFKADPRKDYECDGGYWVTPVRPPYGLIPIPVSPHFRKYYMSYKQRMRTGNISVCYHGDETIPAKGILLSSSGIPSIQELHTAHEYCYGYKVCKGHDWCLSREPCNPDGPRPDQSLTALAGALKKAFGNW